jgi:hypothetical protein
VHSNKRLLLYGLLHFDYGLPVDMSAMRRVECEVHAIKIRTSYKDH